MVDIVSKLAAEFIASQGWCCILITPHDLARQSIVTIDGIAARDDPGQRVWLQRKHADRVVTAFFSRCQHARRKPRGSGLQVQLPATEVAGMVRDIAFSLGVEVVGDEAVDEQLALVTLRIAAALPRVKRGLSRQYAAARASGESLPRYDLWLLNRLKPAFALGLG